MKARLAGVALLALAVSGCGSDQWSTAQKTYKSAVGDLNKAHDQFNTQVDTFDKKSAKPQEYVSSISAFATALKAFNDKVRSYRWPAGVEADATALIDANTKLIRALDDFSSGLQKDAATNLADLGNVLGSATDQAAAATTQFETDLATRRK